MNASPVEQNEKLAAVLRSARKRAGLSQAHVARVLGISQSKLSKVEAGSLSITVPQWFDICDNLAIPVDSARSGLIDIPGSKISNDSFIGKFRLPRRYSEYAGSTARTARIFLELFAAAAGRKGVQQFLDERRIDPDYFVQLNNPINIRFITDLLQTLESNGMLSVRSAESLASLFVTLPIHYPFQKEYDCENRIDSLQALIRRLPHYEQNHAYEITERTARSAVVSITPREHVVALGVSNDTGVFLSTYYGLAIKKFLERRIRENAVNVKQIECFYKGEKRCLYRATLAS